MVLLHLAKGARPARVMLAGALAVGVASCSMPDNGPPPNPLFESVRPAPPAVADNFEARLTALGVRYQRVADEDNQRGCTIRNGVEVHAVGEVRLTRPALLTAGMAERLAHW